MNCNFQPSGCNMMPGSRWLNKLVLCHFVVLRMILNLFFWNKHIDEAANPEREGQQCLNALYCHCSPCTMQRRIPSSPGEYTFQLRLNSSPHVWIT